MIARLQQLQQRLPTRSLPLAIANVTSFAVQGLFAVLLLGLFKPDQVALYLVISQIAFFWNGLALAQSNNAIITNRFDCLNQAARDAWRKSMLRLVFIAPLAYIAILASDFGAPGSQLSKASDGAAVLFIWAAAISICQMTWYLAQAYLLRAGTVKQSAWVRALPALVSVILASIGGLMRYDGSVLLMAGLAGFAVGALFLLPAWLRTLPTPGNDNTRPVSQRDDRSTLLRLIYTLLDGIFFTGLAVVWHSAYGAEEAGWLLILMRLLGFVPSLVSSTWHQVVLAAPEEKKIRGLWVALASSALVVLITATIWLLARHLLLPVRWVGIVHYAWPAALWQTSGCFAATFGYLAFARGRAVLLSKLSCVLYGIVLGVLIIPVFTSNLTAVSHFQILAVAFAGLSLVLTALTLKIKAASAS